MVPSTSTPPPSRPSKPNLPPSAGERICLGSCPFSLNQVVGIFLIRFCFVLIGSTNFCCLLSLNFVLILAEGAVGEGDGDICEQNEAILSQRSTKSTSIYLFSLSLLSLLLVRFVFFFFCQSFYLSKISG